jgi:hypothetical protein
MKIKILDGVRDLFNEDPITFPHTEPYGDPEPFAIRFKVKEGLTSLWINFLRDTDHITAVDWGLDQPVDRDPFSEPEKPCGEEVTVFFRPFNNSFSAGIYLDGPELSRFLSQIGELYTPFPKWFGYPQSIDLAIDSPDFKASKGIFENIDLIPTFNKTVGVLSSTFTTAPRIWASLKEVQYFPSPNWFSWQTYAPFKDIPSVTKIENQGEFGDFLEYLGPTDFMIEDEEGFADPSAYPSGGAPREITKYCVPVKKYSFDKSYTYPQFNTERIEIFDHASDIDEIYIGQYTTSSSASLPVGIGFNGSKVLKTANAKLPKIVVQSGNFTGNFYYGSKILGIVLPDTVEKAYGMFELDNIYVEEDEEPGNNPPLYPEIFLRDQQASQPATPEFIKTKISFGWGEALEKIFPPDEELTIPDVPSATKTISRYARNNGSGAYVSYISKRPDHNWGFFQPKPIPEGCEIIGSYCENLYANQTIGFETFLWYGETGEQELITVHGNITIPALPSTTRVIKNYLKGTFMGAQGNMEVEHVTNPDAAVTKTYLFYGEPAADEEYQTGMNVIANFTPQVDGKIEEEWGERYSDHKEDGAALLEAFIQENVGSLPDTYKTNLLSGGVIIESGPLPNLEYAINWQEDCWLNATADPTSMQTLIVALPPQAKSENAYRRSLQFRSPNTEGQLFFYSGETWGRNPDGSLALNEDGRNRPLRFVTWQNPFTPVDVKQYDRYLSDMTLPDFTITNMDGQVYNAFDDAFSNIYGDADEFFTNYGVDDTITTTAARKGYLGLMAPDYRDMNAMPYAPFAFTWRSSQFNVPGAYIDGKWFSIPVLESEIPSGEKRPDQQLALYKYVYQWARINNDPDSPQQEFRLTYASDASSFREASLTW